MKIGFDFDDVIYNFTGLLFNRMTDVTNGKIDLRNREHYFIENLPGYTGKDIDRIVHEIMMEYWDEGIPEDLAVQGLVDIYNHTGEPISIITSRPSYGFEVTNNWLELISKKQSLFKYELILTDKKSKAPFIQEKRFKFYVEDRLDIIEQIHHLVKYVFLIDKSWNKDIEDCKFGNVIRVKNLDEVYNHMVFFK